MNNNNFWNEAARYGTLIGGVAILFSLLGTLVPNAWLGLAWWTLFVVMLFYIMRHRVTQYATPEMGYSYGRCLGFILAMMLFAGFLEGVYAWLAANWFFPEQYLEQMGRSMAMLENAGFYSSAQMELTLSMMRSPITLIVAGVMAAVFRGLLFGLVVAAFTKCDPDIFADTNRDEQNEAKEKQQDE